MRKPAFCICINKGVDQLHGNHAADQHLCFHHTYNTIPILSKCEILSPLSIFCGCTAWFVSDLVAHISKWRESKVRHIVKQNILPFKALNLDN